MLFSLMARERTTLRELTAGMHVYPQILLNVRTSRKEVLESPPVRAAIAAATAALGDEGRVLVRASGTEPLVRVMIEGDDRGRIERLAADLAATLEEAARA
jgi:phosphoglucosamine mutase